MQIIAPDLGIRNRPEVKLLLNGVGADQSTSIVDSAYSGAKAITRYGDVKIAMINGVPAIFCDGSGDWVSAPTSADFNPGADDLTIRFNAYPTSFSSDYSSFFGIEDASGFPGMFANHRSDGRIRWCLRKASGGNADIFDITSTATIALNTWCDLAFIKNGTTYKVFLNGNLIISTTGLPSMETVNAPFYVGGRSSGYGFTGYIRGFTVARRALWTRNFTPPNRLA